MSTVVDQFLQYLEQSTDTYCRLPLISDRPAVTFPAEERHRPSTSTKLQSLVIETHRYEISGLLRSFVPVGIEPTT